MSLRRRYIAPLLIAGTLGGLLSAPTALAATIQSAPTPTAASTSCTHPGTYSTLCSSNDGTSSLSVRPNPTVHPPIKYKGAAER
jgi:hypothetical protein